MSQTGFAMRRRKLAAQQAAEAEAAAPVDFAGLKVDELRALAEQAGIESFEKMKKAELVAALEENAGND